jgi:hypothetical protein
MDMLMDGLEGQLALMVAISGVLAVLIVAATWLVWSRSRHWVDRGRESLSTGRYVSRFSAMDEPPPPRSPGAATPREERAPAGEDQLASRLVREAAQRAAALRDAWDRSYREARGPGQQATGGAPSGADLHTMLEELIREQRETNALLRQLVDRLGQGR